jgi:glycosyltransferase involved in cell wall biosynthesis
VGRLNVEGRVSIIVPAYNRENYLEYALYSLIAQSYDNLEIVVVNDGSTDRTEEIARDILGRSGRLYGIYNTNGPNAFTPMGLSWVNMVGVGNSTGEWISFFSSDNIMHPNKTERSMNLINELSLKYLFATLVLLQEDGITQMGTYTCPFDCEVMRIAACNPHPDNSGFGFGGLCIEGMLIRKDIYFRDNIYSYMGLHDMEAAIPYILLRYHDPVIDGNSIIYFRLYNKSLAYNISYDKWIDQGYTPEDVTVRYGKYSYFCYDQSVAEAAYTSAVKRGFYIDDRCKSFFYTWEERSSKDGGYLIGKVGV